MRSQRMRRSWTRSALARTIRRLEKETRRYQLLLLQVDHQLLLLKRLSQEAEMLQQEQLELEEAQMFRTEQLELEASIPMEELEAELLQ